MTISTTAFRVEYAGNGSTTDFAVPYQFIAATDLVVTLVDSAGAETVKVNITDYTVTGGNTGSGAATGSVETTSFTPATGETLVIERDTSKVQSTDYVDNDPLPAETIESLADRITLIAQEVSGRIARGLQQPAGEVLTLNTIPIIDDRAQKVFAWDANGQPIASNKTLAEIEAAVDAGGGGGGGGGSGDVTGPVSSTARAIALWADTSGDVLKNGPALGTSGHVLISGGSGSDPSFGQVGSAGIASSAVTTAKIADDAVTLAKLAGGTDGTIITFDSSGDPTAVGPGTSGQVLTSNGAGSAPSFQDVGGSGGLIGIQVFTANGTYNKTAGTNSVVVWVVGAGGNGGDGDQDACCGDVSGGGGGGGGAAMERLTSGFDSQSVTVGTTAGATSSFGALLSATGGGSGTDGSNGNPGVGGAGGAGSGGDVNLEGGTGQDGDSGGAGGSGGGAPGAFGSGGGGGGIPNGSGNDGANYGGGGGGGGRGASPGSGAAFAPGIVVVFEYA